VKQTAQELLSDHESRFSPRKEKRQTDGNHPFDKPKSG